MLSYCLTCRKNTKNIDQRVSKTSNGKTMILSKFSICGSKKSNFIKEQEAKELLGILGIRTPLSKITILGDFFFNATLSNAIECNSVECNSTECNSVEKKMKK